MAKGWQTLLLDSRTMEPLGTLVNARSRTLEVDNNRSGSSSLVYPMKGQFARSIRPWKTAIAMQYDDEWLWSGPISQVRRNFASGRISVNAVGWFDNVMPRSLRDALLSPGEVLPLTFTNTDAVHIARDLLQRTNAISPTGVSLGTWESTQPRTITYQRDQGIGQAIIDLAELEAGFDWYIDPTTREFNLVARRGSVKSVEWTFIEGSEANNLVDVDENEDGTSIVNHHTTRGRISSASATDPVSESEFFLRETVTTLADVSDTNILNAYANAEIVYLSQPRTTYTIQPKASSDSVRVKIPRFRRDFDLGDTNFLTARRDGFTIERQPIRVFGVGLEIRDDGSERITRLQTNLA